MSIKQAVEINKLKKRIEELEKQVQMILDLTAPKEVKKKAANNG